jgi:hypothetical protein
MSIKLKALGLGLIAAMAMGSFAVVNASATVSGHFTQDSGGTATITGKESFGTAHRLKFASDGGTPIECDVAHYSGTVAAATVTTMEVVPAYSQCHTEKEAAGTVTVDVNKCSFVFHSGTGHATTGLKCPAGVAGILITHPNCTMRMPPQEKLSGVTYTQTTEATKHTITLDATVSKITAHYEGGICIFLGTTHSATMTGSATVEGLNAGGTRVNVTAT